MKNNAPKYVLTGFEQAGKRESVLEAELKKVSDKIKKRSQHIMRNWQNEMGGCN